MPIYKDDGSGIWHYRHTITHDGSKHRFHGSCFTKDKGAAQEYFDTKVVSDLWRKIRLGERPTYTWDQAAALYLDRQLSKRDIENVRDRLRWLQPHLAGARLQDINEDRVMRVLATKRNEGVRNKAGVRLRDCAEGTINRYWAVISGVMHAAHARGWIDSLPKFETGRERARVRYLADWDEATRLLIELPYNTAKAALYTLYTGLREANVRNLRKSRCDLRNGVGFVPGAEFKNGEDFRYPIPAEAVPLIDEATSDWVFGILRRDGNKIEPVGAFNTAAFEKACTRAGITDFHWHDLRHTWASWHVMNGTPLEVLQKLGGWKDYKMVLRYAHLAPDYIRKFASGAGSFGRSTDTEYAHAPMIKLPTCAQVIELNGVADGTRTHDNRNHKKAASK